MGILSTNQKIIKIGGGGAESSGAVHYDYVQQLTDIQKQTARNNIGIKGYSAGNNIDITNHIISVTGDLGHTYSGIDPIIVNNLTDQIKLSDSFISGVSSISSKQDQLSAGNYIDITDNIISVTGKDYSGVNHINVDNDDEEIGLDSIGNQVIDKVNSAQYKWDDTSYVVATNSGNWNSTYTTVNTNSAAWNERSAPYSAGANINITNHVISGRDWQPEINTKLNTTAFSTVSGTFLTAHQNIPSSGNWNSTFETVSTNSAQWGQGGSEYIAGSNINITNKVISGRNWSPEINTKLNTTAFSTVSGSFLTAHQDISNKVNRSELSTSGNWNDTYETVSTNSAQWGQGGGGGEYTAGSNINITNHVISGRDWQPEINTKLDITAYSESSSTFITSADLSNYYTKNETSGKDELSEAFDSTMKENLLGLSAGTITSYNGSAFAGGGGGKVYSGISPIVVDNVNDTVGLSGTWSIVPGSNINFDTDNVDKTVEINVKDVYNGTTTRFNTIFEETFNLSGEVSANWHYKLGSSGPGNSLLPMDLNWNGLVSSNFSFYLIADQVGYLISDPSSTGTWRRQITYVPSGLSNLHIYFKTLGESNNIFCNRIDYTIQKIDGPLGDNLFNVSSQYGDYGYELWGSTLGNPYSGIQANQ